MTGERCVGNRAVMTAAGRSAGMKVTVTFRHLDPTPALKAYAAEKLASHVEKLLITPESAHWILSVEKLDHIAELEVTANGKKFFGKEVGDDLYAAIDLVVDKLA